MGEGKVVVATDQHLGYSNSDVKSFQSFLDFVSGRSDVGTLVMLGDFVDMWRRDVSGLFLEAWESVKKLSELGSSMKVYFVVGNHDYHLKELLDHEYPFEFRDSMDPVSYGPGSYRFMHGWEFDLAQQPPVMEALCYNLSDDAGRTRTEVYNVFEKMRRDLKELFEFHGGQDAYLSHLLQGPEARLQNFLPDVERKAYSSLRPNEILVFGHTHRPFISADGKLGNAGSWVTDAPIHNTFIELDGDHLQLFTFSGTGPSEVLERKPLTELT